MNTSNIPRIRYSPGLCLLCDGIIKKPDRLWCLATHRKNHDMRLKTNPVIYCNTICRTANSLEKAIYKEDNKRQRRQDRLIEQSESMERIISKDIQKEK